MNTFILAQIFGLLGIIDNLLSTQFKDRKKIVTTLMFLNLFSGLNFLCLGSYTSTNICFLGVLQTIINYQFERKNKDVPVLIIIIYIVASIILGMLSFAEPMDIIPIVCSIVLCITLCIKKESYIRQLLLLNSILWLIVDIHASAYTFAVANALSIIASILGISHYDIPKIKNNKKTKKHKKVKGR